MVVSLLFWNCQGAASLAFRRTFKELVRINKPKVMALFEPRISGQKADLFISESGFMKSYRIEAKGFSGGIWILWNMDVVLEVVENN